MSFANNINNTVGVLPPNRGGTGASIIPSNGQILIGDSTNYVPAALSGTNISITNGSGSITLNTPVSETAFLAYVNANINNVTGAGTAYNIASNWTETFDLNNNFSNGTFTAPYNGIYIFAATVTVADLSSAMTSQDLYFTRTGLYTAPIYIGILNPYYSRNTSNGYVGFNGTATIQLNQNDTVVLTINIAGGAGDTADIIGDTTNRPTFFSGALLRKL